MTEKRLGVRLAVRGGRAAKEALKDVGEGGKRAMARFSNEVEQANRRLSRFGRRATQAGRLAVAAATTAAAAMVRSGLQTIDNQAKLAQSLDTTTGSVQILERAAELAGVSLAEAGEGASRLTRRISLAAQGTGPAVKAFERLGLNLEQLSQLPLDQRLIAINDAIEQSIPVLEQAGVRSQIFGDRAFAAFQRLDNDTIRQATEDLERFGVIVSEQDADQIQRTNDAVTRLGLVWRGFTNQITSAVAPALERLVTGLAAVTEAGTVFNRAFRAVFENLDRIAVTAATFAAFMAGRFVAGVVAAAASVRGLAAAFVLLRGALIRTGIGALIVGAGEMVFQFGRLVTATGGFGNAMTALGELGTAVWRDIAEAGEAMRKRLQAVFTDLRASFLRLASELQATWASFVGNLGDSVAGIPGASEIAERLRASAGEASARYLGLGAEASAMEVRSQRLRREAQALAEQGFDKASAAAARLAKVISEGEGGDEGAAEALRRLQEGLETLNDAGAAGGASGGSSGRASGKGAIDELNEKLSEAEQRMVSFRDSAGQTFADIVTGANNASDALGNLFRGLANSFLTRGFNSLTAALFPDIPGFASGTNFAPGGLALVGERGPELVNLPRGSQVFPANKTRSMMGGVSVHIHVNAQGAQVGVADQVAAAMRQAVPAISSRVLQDVQSARRRGIL